MSASFEPMIDPRSHVAPYEQVRMQVVEGIRSGALAPGTKLPTVRHLAGTLGLAANTVARAYRELEADDLIQTRGRNGTFVTPSGDPALRQAQLAAVAYAERVRQLGLGAPEALELVASALGR